MRKMIWKDSSKKDVPCFVDLTTKTAQPGEFPDIYREIKGLARGYGLPMGCIREVYWASDWPAQFEWDMKPIVNGDFDKIHLQFTNRTYAHTFVMCLNQDPHTQFRGNVSGMEPDLDGRTIEKIVLVR